MLGSYTCRQCRARLSRRIAPVRNPRWQPRATFLSFRGKAQDDAEPTQAQSRPLQQREAENESRGRPLIRYGSVQERSQPRGRYSGRVEGDGQAPRQPSSAPLSRTKDGGGKDGATVSRTRGPACAIDSALAKDDVGEAWAVFEKSYTSRDCEALTEPPLGDVALLNRGRIFRNLLKAVTSTFCNTPDKAVITPTAALLKYEQLGLARHDFWARDTLGFLTYQAILAVDALPNESVGNHVQAILHELLSVWRLFFQCKGMNEKTLDAPSPQWNLPAVGELPNLYPDKDFGMRLQKFHPRYVGDAALGFCAVYFHILSDSLGAVETLHKDAKPFLHFLERLLANSRVDSVFSHTHHWYLFKALPKEVQDRILSDVNTTPKKAMSGLISRGETLGQEAKGDEAANNEAFHLKRIARAAGSRNSSEELNRLWKEIVTLYTTHGKPAVPRRIYNAFLSGFMVLLQAQRSVEVWNHMIAHNIKPDIQSWVAVLDGCIKAKDLNGFNAMWTRMLNTGIEPDNYAWTTRISGLFSLNQVNLGLAALDDMGKRWMSAENINQNPQTHSRNRRGENNVPSSAKAVNRSTKPSIEVINGAITALVKIRATNMRHEKRVEHIQKILAWAANFSVKPDAITYNALIQLYLRAGDFATAFKILGQMERDGVEGDVATYSLLITASFDNHSFNGLTEAQQADKIITLFDSIEAGGVRLNEFIYGTAIDRLSKQYSNNIAVRRIIDHMHKRNVNPSAQIYTMLITHHFQQEPPVISAVDSLVEQIFSSNRTPTDRTLFDRLIEGYAHHGEVGKMMSVLTRMSKLGTLPGFPALSAVIEALMRDSDYARARDVVRDVHSGLGVAKAGITGGRAAEARFFALVKSYGLDKSESDLATGAREEGAGEPTAGEEITGAQSLDPESIGDFTFNDKAIKASRDERVLGDQLRAQEIQQMAQREEVQEDDVHAFLTDDHDDYHSKVNRPQKP